MRYRLSLSIALRYPHHRYVLVAKNSSMQTLSLAKLNPEAKQVIHKAQALKLDRPLRNLNDLCPGSHFRFPTLPCCRSAEKESEG